MKKIYILSGKTGIGKTTFLANWIKENNADGILAPVLNSKRHLHHISSNQIKKLEVAYKAENKKTISVGKYLFDENIFEWAREKLFESFKSNPEWLVIDEIGPLELNGKGLEPAISQILKSIDNQSKIKIIFVVRENLIDKFFKHYKLNLNNIEFLKM